MVSILHNLKSKLSSILFRKFVTIFFTYMLFQFYLFFIFDTNDNFTFSNIGSTRKQFTLNRTEYKRINLKRKKKIFLRKKVFRPSAGFNKLIVRTSSARTVAFYCYQHVIVLSAHVYVHVYSNQHIFKSMFMWTSQKTASWKETTLQWYLMSAKSKQVSTYVLHTFHYWAPMYWCTHENQ